MEEPQTLPQEQGEANAKKKPRGRPFTGKDDPRNRKAAVALVPGDGSLYEDMLYVRTHRRSEDKTEGHRDCRNWKTKDLKGFMAKFAELEKQNTSLAGRDGGQGHEAPDEGSERVEELIQKILEQARRDAGVAD